MRKILTISACLTLASCGFMSVDNELVGQVKKTHHSTPLICSDYQQADISLGVMRNGTGSLSTQDMWVTVPDKDDFQTLKKAEQSGQLVKITYNTKRFAFCTDMEIITKVELVK